MIRKLWAAGLVCVGLSYGVFDTRPAAACSILAPPPALRGYPSDGAADVPTDVVPFYTSDYLLSLSGAEFTLTSSDGESIAAQPASAQVGILELRFEEGLQPSTTYTLLAKLARPAGPNYVESLELSFTTGAGPVSAPPAPPQASLQSYRFAPRFSSSCEPWTEGTCVAVSSALPVEETRVDESGRDLEYVYLHREPWFTQFTEGGPRCVRLRTRAANATYSSTVVHCGADAPLFTLCGSQRIACTSQGITQDGAPLPALRDGSGGASAASSCAEQGGGHDAASAGDSGSSGSESGGAAPDTSTPDASASGAPPKAQGGCNLAASPQGSSNVTLSALLALAVLARCRRFVRD